ncbi:hypothetical protein BT63DRAFT_479920 [Microthyrium microscopicum]|uniref:Polyprenal reductase n=1 Tax=Microthyrium microscopicum TaxID=703497 RepID=A0A6A6U8L4_9PEZI|nr:hypothetical protein BT63DRAFT_479920 [Microthyrium microscopicum]
MSAIKIDPDVFKGLLDIHPNHLIIFLYTSISVFIIALYKTPILRDRFLRYGVRNTPQKAPTTTNTTTPQPSLIIQLLDTLKAITVPHAWFTHFYILATITTTLTLHQSITTGPLLPALNLPHHQLSLAPLGIFLLHVLRRLYESITLTRPSTSRMWIGHYVMGLLHYTLAPIALIADPAPSADLLYILPFALALLAFSIAQHKQHVYLASLPRGPDYILPNGGAFSKALAPHYGCEVGIYVCLLGMRLSGGGWDWTVASMLGFVVINLGVSVRETRRVYRERFGDVVEGKGLMWPCLEWGRMEWFVVFVGIGIAMGSFMS